MVGHIVAAPPARGLPATKSERVRGAPLTRSLTGARAPALTLAPRRPLRVRREARLVEGRLENVRLAPARAGEGSERLVAGERGHVEKSGDPVHVEQVPLGGAAGQADGDHGCVGQDLVALPRAEWRRRQQVVVTDDDLGAAVPRRVHRAVDAHGAHRVEAEVAETQAEVVAEVLVPTHAQCSQGSSLSVGWYRVPLGRSSRPGQGRADGGAHDSADALRNVLTYTLRVGGDQ